MPTEQQIDTGLRVIVADLDEHFLTDGRDDTEMLEQVQVRLAALVSGVTL